MTLLHSWNASRCEVPEWFSQPLWVRIDGITLTISLSSYDSYSFFCSRFGTTSLRIALCKRKRTYAFLSGSVERFCLKFFTLLTYELPSKFNFRQIKFVLTGMLARLHRTNTALVCIFCSTVRFTTPRNQCSRLMRHTDAYNSRSDEMNLKLFSAIVIFAERNTILFFLKSRCDPYRSNFYRGTVD